MNPGLRRRPLIATGVAMGLGLISPVQAQTGPASAANEREPLLVRYAMSQQQNAEVLTYEVAVLKLLLEKTLASHGPYRVLPSQVVSQNRAFLQLQDGSLDLLTSMTSREREAQATAVRVCLYRGLQGVRLPIALASRRAELEAVQDAQHARQLRIAQVADWPDAQVLAANGWALQRIPRLAVFPELMKRQRIDLFALGATEVYPVIDPMPELAVLDQWLIAYPSAFYFFVSPLQPKLAQRLRQGFELAMSDGSFDALFEHWVGPQLNRARLADRRWLVLRNPDLPPQTPTQEARLWHPLVRHRVFATHGQ